MTGINSMTGFASAEGRASFSNIKVEIRTLNHRFFDAKVRLPKHLQGLDQTVREVLKKKFSRGAIDLRIESNALPEAEPQFELNTKLAKRHYQEMLKLGQELDEKGSLEKTIELRDLLQFPDVITRKDPGDELGKDKGWAEIQPVLDEAIGKLADMRAVEGKQLLQQLESTINFFRTTLSEIKVRKKEKSSEIEELIKKKVEAVFEAHPISDVPAKTLMETRIAQELMLVVDRTDIEEELIRFSGHVDQFEKCLEQSSPIGRKLEFILQEILREVNTMGSKAQDIMLGQSVVKLKVAVEQLREQVMNLE